MVYKKKNGYCVFNQENVRSDSVIWSWKYFSSSDEESWIKKKKHQGSCFTLKSTDQTRDLPLQPLLRNR